MAKQQTIISLDPIDQKKKKGLVARLLVTRWYGGKKSAKQEPFGHYMFCGKQRQGKSVSIIWYFEKKLKYYQKHRLPYIQVIDDKTSIISKFDTPPVVELYSNMGIGQPITRNTLYSTISSFDPYANAVRFVLIDEIQVYFKRDSKDKTTAMIGDQLSDLFCQLGKRNTYIFSTSQVYGRVDKALREQCLFMVDCTKTRSGKFKNEFIDGDDIMCDELGRWSGNQTAIYIHGLPKNSYDTKKIITIE